ncbi:MAG: twin-arginine translocase subunit TatC [Sphingomonas sp.]
MSTDIDELEDTRAPLLDHIIELRRRLIYCLIALVITFFACFYFSEDIFAFLLQPLKSAGQSTVIYTQIFEAFFVQVKVAFFAAMMISFPIIANQFWQFVAPGLYRKEKKALLPFLLATPVLFLLGAAMAYFVAVPMALHFLLGFQGDVGGVRREALPAVSNYLTFIMQFLFGFGLAFLLPILMLLLARAGIVTRKQLISVRRYAIVASFAVAAVLTPPDVGSQLLLAIPLCILYELGLIAIWFTERRQGSEGEAAAAE